MRLLTFAICPTCGKRFRRYGAIAQTQIYCSNHCAVSPIRVARETRVCEECGAPFEVKVTSPKRFCSAYCSNHSSLSKKRKEKECPICGTFHIETEFAEYCSERCIDIAIAIEN